jgi:hypothetical protein
MSIRCKPGDLAIIVKSYFPDNIGLIVKVLKAYGNDDPDLRFPDRWQSMWLVECNQPMHWDSPETGQNYFKTVGPRSDAYLHPIRGVPPKKRSNTKRNKSGVSKQKVADPMQPAVDLVELALEDAMSR